MIRNVLLELRYEKIIRIMLKGRIQTYFES